MTDSVTYGGHFTRNLQNFENAKVYFEVTSSVRDDESFDDAFDRIEELVDARIVKKVEQIDAESGF